MDKKDNRFFQCAVCSKRAKPRDRRSLGGHSNKALRKHLYRTLMLRVTDTDVICGKCRVSHFRRMEKSVPEKVSSLSDSDPTYLPPDTKRSKPNLKSPKNIALPLSSVAGSSHSTCCVCRRRGLKFVTVPAEVRYNTLIESNIIIPAGLRCCPGHLAEDRFKDDVLANVVDVNTKTNLNRTEIADIIQNVREIALKNKTKRIDFDETSDMSDSDFQNLLGISKQAFEDICDHVKDIRQSKVRSQRTCIGILLTKLRSGMSNRLLSTVFNIGIDSVKRAIASARKTLANDFTSNYIGFEHIDRETVISHQSRQLADTLFGGSRKPAILVLDGTYIYIQKSSQFQFQRRSYSLHKKRPLVKHMMIVTTTGYVVSVLAPYLSDYSNNDANIMKHAFANKMERLKDWLQEDDVFIVDRGFRDAIEAMHDLGIHTEMPEFLKKGQKLHSTEESNSSRLVTKIGWVVESMNGRLKKWKYLDNIVVNTQILYIGDYVRLVCAIMNKYCKPLSISQQDDELLGIKMLFLAKQSNNLMQLVEEEGLDRLKTCWKAADEISLTEFPNIDEEDLRNITFGVYQPKLAKCYTREHLEDNGHYNLLFHKLRPGLLMAKIQSRHVSSKSHKLWVQFNEVMVTGWYCKCRAGARVVGACAHVSAVIWYLGYARHHSISVSSYTDWTMYLQDAKDLPEPVLVDDDTSDYCEE